MAGKIAFAVCEHYRKEAEAALAEEKRDDVVLITFPSRCGRPVITEKDLGNLPPDVEQIEIFGASCVNGFAGFDKGRYAVHVHKLKQCFELVADPVLIDRCLSKGAYLTTPGWLSDWKAMMERLGLDRKTAREMFAETTTGIVLFDTGVGEQSVLGLPDFADHIQKPYEMIFTGICVLRLLFSGVYSKWQLGVQESKYQTEIGEVRKQQATYAMAMDLLSNLARIVNEAEAVEAMLDVYTFLFAPGRLCYLGYEENRPDKIQIRPIGICDEAEEEAIRQRLAAVSTEEGFVKTDSGFLLRIVRRGEIRGVIAVEEIAFPEYLDPYLNLALSIVDLCELPIENARKYEKLIQTEDLLRKANENLYQLSTTDALTGIANRRAYDEYMEMEWKKMLRNNVPLALIVCDIDFFKKYNDRYGHKEGDVCLHTIAQIIRKTATRPGDFVARYGGEEFAVVLSATKAEGAWYVAEKIRTAVARHGIPHEDSAVASTVTLSLGVACLDSSRAAGVSTAALFRVADAALYDAKRQGRNRVVLQVIETG